MKDIQRLFAEGGKEFTPKKAKEVYTLAMSFLEQIKKQKEKDPLFFDKLKGDINTQKKFRNEFAEKGTELTPKEIERCVNFCSTVSKDFL